MGDEGLAPHPVHVLLHPRQAVRPAHVRESLRRLCILHDRQDDHPAHCAQCSGRRTRRCPDRRCCRGRAGLAPNARGATRSADVRRRAADRRQSAATQRGLTRPAAAVNHHFQLADWIKNRGQLLAHDDAISRGVRSS